MIDHWRRLPAPVQDVVAALALGAAWFGTAAFWEARGWHPAQPGAFDLAGFAAVVAVALRRVAPAPVLAGGVVAYAVAYDMALTSEFHLLPVLVVAYVAADRRPGGAALVAAACLLAGLLLTTGALHDATGRGIPQRADWSRVIFDELVVATTVLLGGLTAAQRRAAVVLAARNAELERLRGVEADRAVGRERARIARELHDDVAHHLTAMVVRAQAVERVSGAGSDAAVGVLPWMADTARDALASVRQTVAILREGEGPAPLALGARLVELPALVARVESAGVEVRLEVADPLPSLDHHVDHAAVRIVQESLTNVLRHASASHVTVAVVRRGGGVEVRVDDDGVGSTPSGPTGGLGLLSMRERAESCGGSFDVGPGPSGGWRVRAWLPGARRGPR